jgi:hypothetical protein
VCLSLTYPARKAHEPCYAVIGGMSGSNTVFHIISQNYEFWKDIIELKMRFDFLQNSCLKYFSFEDLFSEIVSYMYKVVQI